MIEVRPRVLLYADAHHCILKNHAYYMSAQDPATCAALCGRSSVHTEKACILHVSARSRNMCCFMRTLISVYWKSIHVSARSRNIAALCGRSSVHSEKACMSAQDPATCAALCGLSSAHTEKACMSGQDPATCAALCWHYTRLSVLSWHAWQQCEHAGQLKIMKISQQVLVLHQEDNNVIIVNIQYLKRRGKI